MKHLIRFACTISIINSLLFLQSCQEAPKGDNVTITEKQDASEAKGTTFIVDTTASRVRFTGHGVGKNHPGNFKLSSGTVALAGNEITGGNFVINIKSMDLEQKGGVFDSKLHPHLMSGDFFDVDKFSTASFEITKVEPYRQGTSEKPITEGANYNVSGNFTLKEVTRNITFPARIDLDGNSLRAQANFDVDRRQWSMNYGNDKTLGDKFISETVNIELFLKAKKQE